MVGGGAAIEILPLKVYINVVSMTFLCVWDKRVESILFKSFLFEFFIGNDA